MWKYRNPRFTITKYNHCQDQEPSTQDTRNLPDCICKTSRFRKLDSVVEVTKVTPMTQIPGLGTQAQAQSSAISSRTQGYSAHEAILSKWISNCHCLFSKTAE